MALSASAVACGGTPSDESDATDDSSALSKDEQVAALLLQGVSSQDSTHTGVDTWDVGVVTNGQKRYIVAMGFKGLGQDTRQEVIEFLISKDAIDGTNGSHILARSADPDKPVSVDAQTFGFISKDFDAMRPDLEAKLSTSCGSWPAWAVVISGFGAAIAYAAVPVCLAIPVAGASAVPCVVLETGAAALVAGGIAAGYVTKKLTEGPACGVE